MPLLVKASHLQNQFLHLCCNTLPNANTKKDAAPNTNIVSSIEITKQCIQYHDYQHESVLYLYVFQPALLHYVELPFDVFCLTWIFSADMGQ